jgi:hypothetical protein
MATQRRRRLPLPCTRAVASTEQDGGRVGAGGGPAGRPCAVCPGGPQPPSERRERARERPAKPAARAAPRRARIKSRPASGQARPAAGDEAVCCWPGGSAEDLKLAALACIGAHVLLYALLD